MKKNPVIEIKLNSWNKLTKKERVERILWLLNLLASMNNGTRFSDDFFGKY